MSDEENPPPPEKLGDDYLVLSENEDSTVGLVEYTGSLDDWEPVHLDPKLLIEFAEECIDMGWEGVTVHLREDMLVMAHELGEDDDFYVAMAPRIEGEGDS